MKKFLKILIYLSGLCLIVGVGIWSEVSSGDYPRLEKKIESKKSFTK